MLHIFGMGGMREFGKEAKKVVFELKDQTDGEKT